MSLLSTSLQISGYKDAKFFSWLGDYTVQLNPSKLSVSVAQNEKKSDKDADALGTTVTGRAPIFLQKTLNFTFTLDYTGIVPHSPSGILPLVGDLTDSIEKLESLTVEPVSSTHRPPYVRVQWGSFSIKGTVPVFSYDYTFFDSYGTPLRAEVTMSVVEIDGSSALLQSPDITKMPTVKEGDTIVKLSQEFYDDKKYYIKLADYNKMSSLRDLKKGSQFEIPPINK